MFSYHSIDPPDGKELLVNYNQELSHTYRLNFARLLSYFPTSLMPRILAKYRQVQYEKFVVKDFEHIAFIYKDGEFDSFTWHTNAKNLKTAVRYGIVSTQSVTGRVTSILGQYRLITLDRIKQGYLSNRFLVKWRLLNLFQDRFEALERLESLANQNNSHAEINAAFDQYFNELRRLNNNLDAYFVNTKISELDGNAIADLRADLQEDVRRAKDFLSNLSIVDANKSTGPGSILTFVKKQMVRQLRKLQNINQNVTYSLNTWFAATRGELNSLIEDAELTIENHAASPNESINAEHHGKYGSRDESIAYDSFYHCKSATDVARALWAIYAIENITIDERGDIIHNKDKKKIKVTVVKSTNWYVSGGLWVALKKLFYWVANVTVKLVMGPIELISTILIEPFTLGRFAKHFKDGKAPQIFQRVRELATYEFSVSNPLEVILPVDELLEKAKPKRVSLGLRIRKLAVNAFQNSILDIIYGFRDIYRQFRSNIFDEIYHDYHQGDKVQLSISDVMAIAEKEVHMLATQSKELLEEKLQLLYPDRQYPHLRLKDPDNKIHIKNLANRFAVPEFIPGDGEWDDVLNTTIAGLDEFVSVFLHNIHAKHPFAGLLFDLTYIAGALAVLTPNSVAFLGNAFIKYSQDLGYGMSNSVLASAISSGCTSAQTLIVAYELMLHGPNSWMARNATYFAEDPFTPLIYGFTSLGLGYASIEFQIPWFSDWLREDLGSYPPSSLIFVGAKLGVLVYELLKEHEEEKMEASNTLYRLRAYLRELYQQTHPQSTEEETAATVEITLQRLTSAASIAQLKKRHEELCGGENIQKIRDTLKEMPAELYKMFEQGMKRSRLVYFLVEQREHLTHLSPYVKHQLIQQMHQCFSESQVRSLKQCFYPVNSHSILRTTLNVILGYVAYILRCFIAAPISCILQKNFRPLKSAFKEFGFKILKDVTRVIRALSKFGKFCASFIRRHLKMVCDVFFNSGLARLQAMFINEHSFARNNYAFSGKSDAIYESARQFFSQPVDCMVREVVSANSADTQRKVETSYMKLLEVLPRIQDTGKSLMTDRQTEDKLYQIFGIKHSKQGGQISAPSSRIHKPRPETRAPFNPLPKSAAPKPH